MSDRGIKKWAPYRSLMEQDFNIEDEERKTKPQISIEQANKINNILANYKSGELTISFFKNNENYKITTNKVIINRKKKEILINNNLIIKFDEIIDIEDNYLFFC